ncbi:MAG: hypothetical protein E7335_07185 [Clostridiales bacterium]|nr:hypothetical protein [Clostridiales bacterium]
MYDKLHFVTPSDEFQTGSPLGNGTIGTMHWGMPGQDVFTFNHDSLYRNKPHEDVKTGHAMETMRELVNSGRAREAEAFYNEQVGDIPRCANPYQPFMDVTFAMDMGGEYRNYRKTLDMENALLRFSYELDGKNIRWEAFVTAVHGVSVIRVACDSPICCTLIPSRPEDPECTFTIADEDGMFCTYGDFPENHPFLSCSKIKTDGILRCEDGKVRMEAFTECTVYTALSVDESENTSLKAILSALPGYEEILSAHTKDFSDIYRRIKFDLNAPETKAEDAWKASVEGETPIAMYGYLVNFSRYCIISSSRKGSLPINLQGLWNREIDPPWLSGYTMDINIQMAYWPAQILNLSALEEPLFDWVLSNWDTMQKHAQNIFGAEDAVYINQTTDMYMTPNCEDWVAAFQALWSGACAWIGQHFYNYWRYTNDDEFMRTKGFPYLKACAKFYFSFLYKNAEGKYEISPSFNPENTTVDGVWTVNTATMDILLVHELMQNLISVNRALNLNDPDEERWREIDRNMKDYYYLEDGTLHEFSDATVEKDTCHRHLSHLYGLFPGDLWIRDEKLKEASIKGVFRRLSKGLSSTSSWCVSWHACCFAAMGDGDRALEFVDHLIRSSLMENFLTSHYDWRDGTAYAWGPKRFQIDSLMGISRAIANMFLRSDDLCTTILPALPKRLPNGSFCGLRGYDSFEYDIYWENGRLKKLVAYANRGGKIRLRIAENGICCNRPYDRKDQDYIFENLQVGDRIEITVD